jgi:hypothetical protein
MRRGLSSEERAMLRQLRALAPADRHLATSVLARLAKREPERHPVCERARARKAARDGHD